MTDLPNIPPPFDVQVDGQTAESWGDVLAKFADANIYQTWAYGAVHWGSHSLSHLVMRREGQVVAAAQLRIARLPVLSAGVAYLRWGPLCHLRFGELQIDTARLFASALRSEYVRTRKLCLRVFPNAFAGSERATKLQQAFFDHVPQTDFHGRERTLVLDLTKPLEKLRKGLDQKWRNQLNRAEKNNLDIVDANGPAEYRTFTHLYKEMWNRKRFRSTVDVDEFGRICERLPGQLKPKILLCCAQGVPVSGILCSALGNTGIYLLGATSKAGLQSKGAYLLQWRMIKWLKENGFDYYDLGGIDPGKNPGVFHFKQGLSGQEVVRIAPFEACENPISSICVKAASLSSGRLRGALVRLAKRLPASVSSDDPTDEYWSVT